MLMCTSEAKFIINSTIGAICTMTVNELYKEKQNNVLFVYRVTTVQTLKFPDISLTMCGSHVHYGEIKMCI